MSGEASCSRHCQCRLAHRCREAVLSTKVFHGPTKVFHGLPGLRADLWRHDDPANEWILPTNNGHRTKRPVVPQTLSGGYSRWRCVGGFDCSPPRRIRAPARLRTRGEGFAVDQLHLQGVEEALGAGVAVAVALGAHAAWQAVPIEQVLIDLRAVLVAA